ncbi:MAG: hypothetical protein JWP11_1913 [Frankiales bacterium]|nr:hypothetical protein [Frankiales bacterium]
MARRATAKAEDHVLDFPTLGILVSDWGEAHCPIPDGFEGGEPFIQYDWQLWNTVKHYQLRREARPDQLATAFRHRRSQIVRPQKAGKSPYAAFVVCAEAVGPVLFAGWAVGGEGYDCRDYGCGCGFVYEYEPSEPMGMPWPTPEIQITATSEDQTDNIYNALRPMIDRGPLSVLIPKTGEEFIRLPNGGRIDVVTSNARSRLGQRVTHVAWDETGLYTPVSGMVKVFDTQSRGLAGIGGRGIEYTNAWDPSERSVAQRTAESKVDDIYRDHPLAPEHLRYAVKDERRKIHVHVYAGSRNVDLDGIEAEAREKLETDPAQAERFFGNRLVAGASTWMDPAIWLASMRTGVRVEPGELITIGFDGSMGTDRPNITADSTVLRGCRVSDGFRWTIGAWEAPGPGPWRPPRAGVMRAFRAAFRRFKVVRVYADPPGWQTELDELRAEFGEKVVVDWWTNRDVAMARALEQLHTAVVTGGAFHDNDAVMLKHVENARRDVRRAMSDSDGSRERVLVKKEHPMSPLKIDGVISDALAFEARGDALASGVLNPDDEIDRSQFTAAGFR